MKTLMMTFLSSLLIGSPVWAGGVIVGNGGDVLRCGSDGLFSLDYLLTEGSRVTPSNLPAPQTVQQSLNRIEWLLAQKVPTLLASFREHVRLLKNHDFTQTAVWEEAANGLINIQDEEIVNLLPANCLNTEGKAELIQAIIREFWVFSGRPEGKTLFKYVPQIYAELETQKPLQLSFLLVHEWLWSISQNVDRNRRVGHFLHSNAFEQMSPAQVIAQLQGMGLLIPGVAEDVFSTQNCQGPLLDVDRLKNWRRGFDGVISLPKVSIRSHNCTQNESCSPWETRAHPASSEFSISKRSMLGLPSFQGHQLALHWKDNWNGQMRFDAMYCDLISPRLESGRLVNLKCETTNSNLASRLEIFTGDYLFPEPEKFVYYGTISEECFLVERIKSGADRESRGVFQTMQSVLFGRML
jgi:hypothetical protein